MSRLFEVLAISRVDEGSEGIISVSLLKGRYVDVGNGSNPCCNPAGSDCGEVAQNERDSGSVIEPDISKQDLRKVQNCQ